MASALSIAQAKTAEISLQGWQEAGWLPCQLTAEISAWGFTLGDLLNIEVGSVLDCGTAAESDVFLLVNGARIGCGKLDAVDNRLAVRLTELG